MGKVAVWTWGSMVVLVLSLLLLASCANEQIAKPLPNATGTVAAAPAQAGTPVGKQDAGATVPVIPTKTDALVDPKIKPIANSTTSPPADATVPAAAPVNATGAANTTSAPTTSLVPGCLDTDLGKVYTSKGSVQYVEGNVSIIKTDECLGGDLREWYCDKGELAKEIIICSKGCTDGACIA